MDVIEQADAMIQAIKERARLFVEDNLVLPNEEDFLLIETAMLVGASIALESHLD